MTDPALYCVRDHAWVPKAARNYLAHTVLGHSIRSIARDLACHPSTVSRQVRRLETRRDDPLVDGALRSLAPRCAELTNRSKETTMMTTNTLELDRNAAASPVDDLAQFQIGKDARNILRRLCETGAVLAVGRDMDTAVIVRENDQGAPVRTATVERDIAETLALQEWINSKDPSARIIRYSITAAGREAFRRLTAMEENRAQGLGLDAQEGAPNDDDWDKRQTSSSRYLMTESPLVGLSRRRAKDGERFLTRAQVDVGERIRQDFEIARLELTHPDDWRVAVAAGYRDLPKAAKEARDRLTAALEDLGPGLADIVLRCCCLLEGLETSEKTMGWSARSGKIVLRIALVRLIRHYEERHGKFAPLIG